MSSGSNIYAISTERFRAKVVNVPLSLTGGGSSSSTAGGGGGSGSSSSSLMSGSDAAVATSSPIAAGPTEPLALDDRIDIEPGMTLQIVEQPSSKIALIRIKDFYGTGNRLGSIGTPTVSSSAPVGSSSSPYENRIFQCQAAHLQRIPSDIWPYIIAILDPLERCEFAKRPKLFGSVKLLRTGDIVMVSWLAKNRHITYDCIIRYVGPVPKIGPGYYFGLELLNLENGESPQKDDIDFVSDYMNCEPRLALIVAANWIKFPEHEASGKQPHHKRNLLDSLVCGARDLNNRLSRRTGSSKHASDDTSSKGALRAGKVINGEYPPPYARSYTPDLTSSGAGGANRKSTDIGPLYDSFSCLQMDPAGTKAMHHKKIAASISSPNLSKQDSSSSTGSSGRYVNSHPMESYGDEYHRFVEHGQHQHHHHHHLADGGEPYRSSGRSSQNSSNSGTLKHSKARASKVARSTGSNSSVNSAGGGGGGYHSVSKQSTILSLPDRDVVVIDSNEIDEAIKSASDVIVVDPPPMLSPTDNREVELMDLLGSSSWPAEAGDVAAILSGSSSDKKTQTPASSTSLAYGNGMVGAGTVGYNTSGGSTSSNSTANSSHSYHSHNGTAGRYERNKSLNPLAHIGLPKQGETVAPGTRKARTGDGKPATVDVATMTSKYRNTVTIKNGQNMLPDTYDKDSFDGIPLTVLEHFDWESEPEAAERRLPSDEEEVFLSDERVLSMSAQQIIITASDRASVCRLILRYLLALLFELFQTIANVIFHHTELNDGGANGGGPAVAMTTVSNGIDNTVMIPTGNGLVPRIGSISPESDSGGPPPVSPLQELPNDPSLGVGSMVEVMLDAFEPPPGATTPATTDPLLYGVIRWIGPLPTAGGNHRKVMVGVELEDEPIDPTLETTNGTHNGVRLFKCPANRAIFVHTSQCSRDRRFQDIPPMSPCTSRTTHASGGGSKTDTNMFGKVDCPVVKGRVPPLKILKLEELEEICGKFKGIQGHHNSCYLDATLFAMFTFTSVFDSLLFRPKEPEDNAQYEDVQRVLLEEIVNPLRKNHFVRADRVLKLRQLLDRLSSVTGLMSEEKDPEEFLNSLLAQILRADPFLKLSSGLDTFYYQLFVEKDERLNLPSVQQLFEQSFLASNIKLKEVPSCLIIQMPRFGKNFKMYPRILPSQVLDVTDIIEDCK
uniref:ubiquitinyl hydrolase 1 n=1 Tax=Anopheles christyi TaxID=43041 RepID=A0A182KCT7_9DIPT